MRRENLAVKMLKSTVNTSTAKLLDQLLKSASITIGVTSLKGYGGPNDRVIIRRRCPPSPQSLFSRLKDLRQRRELLQSIDVPAENEFGSFCMSVKISAFSALSLLLGQQEQHSACTN